MLANLLTAAQDSSPQWAPLPGRLPAALQYIILIGGALAVLIAIWRRGVMPVYRAIRKLLHAADRTLEALPVVWEIADQFKNNGGSSMRDGMEAIRATTEKIDGVTESLQGWAIAHQTQDATFQAEILTRLGGMEGRSPTTVIVEASKAE